MREKQIRFNVSVACGNRQSQRWRSKIWFAATKICNKMIFKGLDGAFGDIGAVQVGRDELKSDGFLAHEGFEGCWELVVQNLKVWAETALGQIGAQSRVCADEFVLAP